jgi:hypothetical protein
MKWFNSDLTNKGMRSELVKGLIMDNIRKSQEESKTDDGAIMLEKVKPHKV